MWAHSRRSIDLEKVSRGELKRNLFRYVNSKRLSHRLRHRYVFFSLFYSCSLLYTWHRFFGERRVTARGTAKLVYGGDFKGTVSSLTSQVRFRLGLIFMFGVVHLTLYLWNRHWSVGQASSLFRFHCTTKVTLPRRRYCPSPCSAVCSPSRSFERLRR